MSALWSVYSLWPSDHIWLHRSESTLAQVMAWCLMAPSHYLNQCWLFISKVLWHSSEGMIKECLMISISKRKLTISFLKISSRSPRYQWVNLSRTNAIYIQDLNMTITVSAGGRFKNAYELLNLRALKFSPVNKICIFQCMGLIFCVEFQRHTLKFHTKYLTHTLKDMTFIQHWNFKSS